MEGIKMGAGQSLRPEVTIEFGQVFSERPHGAR